MTPYRKDSAKNRVKSLLSVCKPLLGDSFKPRPSINRTLKSRGRPAVTHINNLKTDSCLESVEEQLLQKLRS